jgi:hypothetical protein
MLRAIVHPSPTIRSALIIAAAVALILPLPARCLSCSSGDADCTTAVRGSPDPAPPPTAGLQPCIRYRAPHSSISPPARRSCCEHRNFANRTAAQAAACQSHIQSKTCGCKLQVPDRTYVAAERQTVPADLVAIFPALQPIFAADSGHADWVTAAYGNLPPPVPHRILHCSWII